MSDKKLPMDPGEILREYRASVTPMKQIKVLAEQGAKLPRNYRRGEDRNPGKAQETPPSPALSPRILTAAALLDILCRVPGDTPVRLLGSGIASSVCFLARYDAGIGGNAYILELEREEDGGNDRP